MRRLAFVASLVFLVACVDMGNSGDADGGTGGSSASDGGVTTAPCQGFRDVTGACLDPRCLATDRCTASSGCGTGVAGPGLCFGGVCMYLSQDQGQCASPNDCACGFCGTDGHCYGDAAAGCGRCQMGAGGQSGASVGNGTAACMACLSDCQGTGPSCCAGCGCLCEGECGVCH